MIVGCTILGVIVSCIIAMRVSMDCVIMSGLCERRDLTQDDPTEG
jgi:hypothetical protein